MSSSTAFARTATWLALAAAFLVGCSGQDGDSAGSFIGGRSLGGPNDNQPLPFLAVSLDSVNLYGVTDREGRFVIPGVPGGTYTLRATKYGKRILSQPVNLAPSMGTTIDLGRIATADGAITLLWPQLAPGSTDIAGRVVVAGCETEPCGLVG
ncbi:MAG TPA: carboxypeptidase regulatory-like domain-containing protein, partial [bacterium]|nr:carboxypeptidase regulatory-like domain-containing protein [bacterium]